MKKLFLIALPFLFIPLANAAPQNWKISWGDNQPVGTIVHVSCGLNIAAKAEVGTVPSTNLSLNFAFGNTGSGDTVKCIVFPVNGAVIGPNSIEVAGTIPLELPALVPVLERLP